MAEQTPSVGRIVHYRLAEQDVDAINQCRTATVGSDGVHVHYGNPPAAGDVYPAMVVRMFHPSVTTANLQVFLDGNDTCWATSRMEGEKPGQWQWPERV